MIREVAEFEKVSEGEFIKFCVSKGYDEKFAKAAYLNIREPKRATKGSAGYDFVTPVDINLLPKQALEVPTGIRVKIMEGWLLSIFPRSGLGFKYQTKLANTVGIIDSDYYYALNEGHIIIKVVNGSIENKDLALKAGERFAQGIFLPFGIVKGDSESTIRKGGFGSTTQKL